MLDLASNLAKNYASCKILKGDGGTLLPCMAGCHNKQISDQSYPKAIMIYYIPM